MNPEFLSLDDVLKIHERELARYGGLAGLRDQHLIESAMAQPQASFGGEYLHEDLFAMASAYLFHIVKNHAFLDGNKRTGLISALTFLGLNGHFISSPSPLLYEATMRVAEGKLGKAELAELFRQLTRKPE